MTTEAVFDADIDEFDLAFDGICAVVLLYEQNDEEYDVWWRHQWAEYPRRVVPEEGRYSPANFEVTVTTAAEPRGIEETVGPVESVAEFEAEVFEMDVDSPVFWFWEDGTRVGEMTLKPDHWPDWFDDVGDRAYVTIRMEYLHEQTVEKVAERSGRTEEDLVQRREATKEWFEECEEKYF